MTVGIELQLLDRVGDPAFAEAFPGQAGDRPRAEHRPHRQLERAGVGAGDDADAVGVGKLEHLAHQVDAMLQPLLAERAAVRAAESVGEELVGAPARRLGAGAGREIRPRRKRRLGRQSFKLSSQRARAALGRRGPPPALADCTATRNANRANVLCCSAQRLDFVSVSSRFGPASKRFTALSRRLVPPSGTEG